MSEIKNWPYFQQSHISPYSSWLSVSCMELRFVPLSQPCELHATGFDCYVHDCGCAEFKFVNRTPEEIAEIRTLQETVRRESILRQADEIRSQEPKP